jgi:hypothetical protein
MTSFGRPLCRMRARDYPAGRIAARSRMATAYLARVGAERETPAGVVIRHRCSWESDWRAPRTPGWCRDCGSMSRDRSTASCGRLPSA